MRIRSVVLSMLLTRAVTCTAFGTCSKSLRSIRSVLPFVRGGSDNTSTSTAVRKNSQLGATTALTDDDTNTMVAKLEDTSTSYAELVKQLKLIANLERAQSVLNYDQLVFMPQNAQSSAERGAQLSAMATVLHEKSTDKKILELIEASFVDLEKSEKDSKEYGDEARLLELEKKSFVQNARIPTELAAKSAELTSSAYAAWVTARKENDFASFEPVLKDCFETAMEVADAKRRDPEKADEKEDDLPSLYTQMLDDFETGMPTQRIDDVFKEIQEALVPLIAKVMASPENKDSMTEPLKGIFPIEKQKELSRGILKELGYNEDMGRFDVSVHPFTTSFAPSDVRITSRFQETEWYQGLAGSIHEGGHAMYEQSLPSSSLSIDKYLSMGTHESQSLFWERHVGLSRSFWKWATPMLKEKFGDDFNYSAEEVYCAVNAVTKSLIRVEADELTYPLHVILRYNIENDIISGKMDVKDIPTRWNKDMKELLNLDVPSDDKGCLQDVHWSSLAIGYFPTYLIGSATAAQLAHYCQQEIEDYETKIEQGQFKEIKQWLTTKVHSHGRRYKSLDDLLESQLGEKLNPKYFIQYLTEKYTDIYKL